MKSKKSCLKYFERPEVVEQISARSAAGLELRHFQTFLREPRGSGGPIYPLETMDREKDLLAAAREGRLIAVKWIFNCMKEAPKYSKFRVFRQICLMAALCGHLKVPK